MPNFIETRRQRLLNIDWSDPAEVYALAEDMSNDLSTMNDPSNEPTFVFDGLSAEQVLNGYWDWLWNTVKQEASLFPDSKARLAQLKNAILANELSYDFLKPDMKAFTPEQINLFRSWMGQWTDFVKQQIEPAPKLTQKKDIRQELFLDNILPVPHPRKYVEVRDYIRERCKYDPEFKKYFNAHKLTDMCHQLTLLFDWFIDPNALGKRLNYKRKK